MRGGSAESTAFVGVVEPSPEIAVVVVVVAVPAVEAFPEIVVLVIVVDVRVVVFVRVRVVVFASSVHQRRLTRGSRSSPSVTSSVTHDAANLHGDVVRVVADVDAAVLA